MEICIPPTYRPHIKAAVMDFDGTISVLRRGWEEVMEEVSLDYITGPTPVTPELTKLVRDYIHQSAGIQTIFQMKWLAQTTHEYGLNPNAPTDPWEYKAEYNRRLLAFIESRLSALRNDGQSAEAFMMHGALDFVRTLKDHGIHIYVASGTDHPDVAREAGLLGVDQYFDRIAGAPPHAEDCSKERVLRELIEESGLEGQNIVVIGDGRVEIALGREYGALTIGIASNEEARTGINPVKRDRLIAAGAHVIIDDFTDGELLGFLGLEE